MGNKISFNSDTQDASLGYPKCRPIMLKMSARLAIQYYPLRHLLLITIFSEMIFHRII